jgi:hypothetical protein
MLKARYGENILHIYSVILKFILFDKEMFFYFKYISHVIFFKFYLIFKNALHCVNFCLFCKKCNANSSRSGWHLFKEIQGKHLFDLGENIFYVLFGISVVGDVM